MEIEPFRLPFYDTPRVPSTEDGYFKMIQSRFIPNFKWISVTSAILGIIILIFIIMHIIYSPPSYEVFLKFPVEMHNWALNIEKVKNNKAYIY